MAQSIQKSCQCTSYTGSIVEHLRAEMAIAHRLSFVMLQSQASEKVLRTTSVKFVVEIAIIAFAHPIHS